MADAASRMNTNVRAVRIFPLPSQVTGHSFEGNPLRSGRLFLVVGGQLVKGQNLGLTPLTYSSRSAPMA
jgi:hypothetical protein